MKETIYFAGGCFWGVQEYFSRLKGVLSTKVGYANGNKENPRYEEDKKQITGHVETVEIIFDNELISIEKLLEHFLRFVDPYSINKQGEDEGIQYRTGVYYNDLLDGVTAETYFSSVLEPNYKIEINSSSQFIFSITYQDDNVQDSDKNVQENVTDNGKMSQTDTENVPETEKKSQTESENVPEIGKMSQTECENVPELTSEELDLSLEPKELKSVKEKRNRRRQAIVSLMHKDSRISMESIAEKLGVNERTIKRDIKELRESGVIERVGGDYGGEWKIVRKKDEAL